VGFTQRTANLLAGSAIYVLTRRSGFVPMPEPLEDLG